ncbi:hypothetical protein E2C01_082682 [Portunus trituberculatus]|uniref:Uncharacterized protein n=1 Tax=Portunus trituberculatus TaxID=210409 RepID=A0A5B7J1H0_PORTR|nr:hypothetical protein [Portunus trituberculatus]
MSSRSAADEGREEERPSDTRGGANVTWRGATRIVQSKWFVASESRAGLRKTDTLSVRGSRKL